MEKFINSWLSIRRLNKSLGRGLHLILKENSLAHWFTRKDDRTENQVIPKSALKNVNYKISDYKGLKSLYQNFIKTIK